MSTAFGVDIDPKHIVVFDDAPSKHEALNQLTDAMSNSDAVTDREAFRKGLFDREAVASTGIGGGVAIPHVKLPEITKPAIGVGICDAGIDFNTLDGEPVHVVVLFAMPAGADKEYLQMLARVMAALREPGFRDRLMGCASADEVLGVLNSVAA